MNLHHCRLYYRRVEEGKQYTVLCRRLASLNEEFISHKSPAAGFDFTSGKKIEQKLLDFNKEAERFGGTAFSSPNSLANSLHQKERKRMMSNNSHYFYLYLNLAFSNGKENLI